eukprot:2959819-Amphidinium_carterae.1
MDKVGDDPLDKAGHEPVGPDDGAEGSVSKRIIRVNHETMSAVVSRGGGTPTVDLPLFACVGHPSAMVSVDGVILTAPVPAEALPSGRLLPEMPSGGRRKVGKQNPSDWVPSPPNAPG